MPALADLHLFVQHLSQPEYVHLLLNAWPVYGMAAGAFMLLWALALGQEQTLQIALYWVVLMGLASLLAVYYGQQGYDRVLAMSNREAQQWLMVHMRRAEAWVWVFYATGAVAAGALVARRWQPRLAHFLGILTCALALWSSLLGGWISQAGGQVRHGEFREGPPAAAELPLGNEQAH
ncbi:MAG: hypothetical protein IT369_11625 [Candidatus Latescibacteria bacterium]|nr:hypothetical protein [Candidatus Latescibacterota bacterium]